MNKIKTITHEAACGWPFGGYDDYDSLAHWPLGDLNELLNKYFSS